MFCLYQMLLFILILNCVYSNNVEIPDKIIIVGDSNVVNMVRNFYIGVILKFKVPNFSVVVWNPSSYKEYEKFYIPVEYSPIDVDDELADTSHLGSYLKKINTRLKIISYYLKHNLSVLNVDADLWFFKNPLELMKNINPEDDITFSHDYKRCGGRNFGLFYVKPTTKSKELFERSVRLSHLAPYIWDLADQSLVNKLLDLNRVKDIKVKIWPNELFYIAFTFFESNNYFVDIVKKGEYIGFHNTGSCFINTKYYRLKELGLWRIDDGEYYSSKSRKYIKYSSEIQSTEVNVCLNIMIYLMYLGKELNRTIIFPRFYHNETYHPFTDYFNLYYFERLYGMNYRENISFFKLVLIYI